MLFCDYFHILFSNHKVLTPLDCLLVIKQIPDDLKNNLNLSITNQDIIYVLYCIVVYKILGIDGFTAKIFKFNWDFVGNQFLTIAHHFFKIRKLPQIFKHTLITLISKSKHSNSITDFHPISLCSTFHKVVNKVLAAKLKPTLPFIISKVQSAFIKGRDISNNISLAQELCGELHSEMHGKDFCAKFDLRKTFDTISISFILF